MKFNRLLLLGALATLSFTACNNEKKAQEEKEKMEMEAKAEADKMKMEEEAKAEAAKKEMEANSIAAVAMGSEAHTTLVAAVKAAGLVPMLMEDEGPYTVFAPTNEAFNALPNGTVEELLKPENKEKLADVIAYHVIPGNVDAAKLTELIKANNGFYMLKTANDGELRAEINRGGNITLTDGRGKKSTIVKADLKASNGYVHAVNTVVMKS